MRGGQTPPLRRRREPTIALINIVFLMLIFFMVAGTLARPLPQNLNLVRTQGLEGRAPPDTLVIHADGRTAFRGEDITPEAYLARSGEAGLAARIVPDRALPADQLLAVADALHAAGAERVLIVTERGLR